MDAKPINQTDQKPMPTSASGHLIWEKLKNWSPDKLGAAIPFSKRLAAENGWSHRFALEVVEEYKKFVFMACTGGQPVTPSEEVDQCWHLHLCYTKNYWDELCGEILGQPLHHNPTEGGVLEKMRFSVQYDRTLELYLRTFQHEPPAKIWPAGNIRFTAGLWKWTNRRQYWIVPKPDFGRFSIRKMLCGIFAVLTVVVLSGCTAIPSFYGLVAFGIMFLLIFPFNLAVLPHEPDRIYRAADPAKITMCLSQITQKKL